MSIESPPPDRLARRDSYRDVERADNVVPLREGNLALGTYQGIFFCEFDGPRDRKVYLATLS